MERREVIIADLWKRGICHCRNVEEILVRVSLMLQWPWLVIAAGERPSAFLKIVSLPTFRDPHPKQVKHQTLTKIISNVRLEAASQ